MKTRILAMLCLFLFGSAVILSGCSKEETAKKNETSKKSEQTQSTTNDNKESTYPTPSGTKLPINASASKLEWEAGKVTGKHEGTVKIKNGDIYVESDKVTGGIFEIDFTSIEVLDLKDAESNAKLTNHLKSDDFFSASSHPVGKFTIASVEPYSDAKGNNMKINGTLTIKGIAKPVSFPATIKIEKGKVSASADFTVDRTQWDIKFRSGKFYENLGDKLIYDDFRIKLNLFAGA
jgi:polyisoprenoid-binding protein YceI